jgi:L-glyceraldehyde 3-phosphate reductase
VDIFYTHRHDPETSLDETLQALTDIVRSGKALYVGVSNYPARLLPYIYDFLAAHGTPCLLHQAKYNIFDREPEIADSSSILSITKEKNSGFISYSPLAQGLLTDRYLNGIPTDSRAARNATLQKDRITPALTDRLNKLNDIARKRGQSLAQMALAWNLKDDLVTSVIIGASSVAQIDENLKAIQNTEFSPEEIEAINRISLG